MKGKNNRIDVRVDDGVATLKGTVDTASERAKAERLGDEMLRHADVFVTTNNGVVTLSGTVPSEAAHRRAMQMARGASGVRRVEDKLCISGAVEPMPPQ